MPPLGSITADSANRNRYKQIREQWEFFHRHYEDEPVSALTRDGESIVSLSSKAILWRSTQTGQIDRRISLKGFRPTYPNSNQIRVSTYGSYAFYRVFIRGVNSTQWRVINPRDGSALWDFKLDAPNDFAVFSPDETEIVLPVPSRKQWEIRDPTTGKILRTLPLIPGAICAAFSPDNSTIYSVANGVLYRQRAR